MDGGRVVPGGVEGRFRESSPFQGSKGRRKIYVSAVDLEAF
jgi:hypothetical protein